MSIEDYNYYDNYEDEDDDNLNDDLDDYYIKGYSNNSSSSSLNSNSYNNNSSYTTSQLEKKINLSVKVSNEIIKSEKKSEKRLNYYGRDDRATSEQVLDPRTRMILFKLLNSNYLLEINGCLSTGKEANVYYAKGENNLEYAVKIFKTSILVFKDRDRYVTGEHRFRHGYCKSNPRKMVRTWAEKEMRNLKRLATAGIPCPIPRLLKQHVLIMDFLGQDGWCAPRLKEVTLTLDESIKCYHTIITDMRLMYHECNLVHGDLSEYNLLWYKERPIIIDVSQSVEHAHPFANDFLKKDIQNVNEFFQKKDVLTLSNYYLYQFITLEKNNLLNNLLVDLKKIPHFNETNEDILNKIQHLTEEFENESSNNNNTNITPSQHQGDIMNEEVIRYERSVNYLPPKVLQYILEKYLQYQDYLNQQSSTQTNDKLNESEIQEAVFLRSYIPSSLNEFSNPVMEKNKLDKGQREAAYTSAINQMLGNRIVIEEPSKTDINKVEIEIKEEDIKNNENSNNNNNNENDTDNDNNSNSEDEDDEEEDSDSDDSDYQRKKKEKYRRRLPGTDSNPEERKQIKEERKEAKRLAKEMAALKRTQKVPKHVKKRAVKNGKKK